MSRQQPYAVVTDSRALRRVRMALVASVAVMLVAVVMVVLALSDLKGEVDAANADRAQVKTDLSAALAKANERLVEAGEKPVTAPPVAGPQGLPGDVGRPPTPDEIRDAVAAYCSGGKCRGPAGASVTRGEVAAAVTVFCDARGECRGPRGGAGSDGTDGSDGGTGPQGPPPTDAQVSAAVAAFCADGRCRGAVGPAGPQGPAGAPGGDGRGIASIICESVPELRLVINFTDGTRQTVDCTLVGSSGQG